VTYDPLRYADQCRSEWPDSAVRAEAGPLAMARVRCTSCECYTIPVRIECSASGGTCALHVPGKYPCPVCGQIDQYIPVWIAARARHHAASMQSLRAHGYVSLDHGPLRAPWRQELAELDRREFVVLDNGELSVASVRGLRADFTDVRGIELPPMVTAQLIEHDLARVSSTCKRCYPALRDPL
jgi:hypothetical protein